MAKKIGRFAVEDDAHEVLVGDPIGFWEVHDGAPVTCVQLVRHTSQESVVLDEAHLRTKRTVRENRRQILARVALWSRDRRGLGTAPMQPTRRAPTRLERLACRARELANVATSATRSLVLHDEWNVGIVDAPIESILGTAPSVRWLPKPRRALYNADPFGLVRDGELTIVCEQYSYDDCLGRIVTLEPERHVDVGPAVHLSYPYVFEWNGRTLCIPETANANEVALYEAVAFPTRWTKVATLIPRSIVDATIFSHDGRWWIAGTDATVDDGCSALSLWFAETPLGPWTPHRRNPVKVDVRSARSAGTPFVDRRVLYRPAQDCSRTYGGRVVVNRVLELSPDAFREEPVASVEPDPRGPYPDGLHTIAKVGEQTLIDGKRTTFIGAELRNVLKRAFGR